MLLLIRVLCSLQEARAKKIWSLFIWLFLWPQRMSSSQCCSCWDTILYNFQKLFAVVLGLMLLSYHLGFLFFALGKMRNNLILLHLHVDSFASSWIFGLKSVGLWILWSLFHCKDTTVLLQVMMCVFLKYLFEIFFSCAVFVEMEFKLFSMVRGLKRGTCKNCNLLFCLRITRVRCCLS